MADSWYYSSDGKAVGPHSLEEIQLMAASGKITAQDHICSDGKTWQVAAEVPGLQFGASPLGYQGRGASGAMVTARAVDLFRQTSLWVRIMSIIMFIVAGLMILGGLAMMVLGMVEGGARGDVSPAIVGVIYIPVAILGYVIPAVFLSRYASRAKAFATLRHENLMDEALQAQKSFWKYCVILTLVVIGLYLLAAVAMFLFVAAFRHL